MRCMFAKPVLAILAGLLLVGCASQPERASGLPEGLDTMICGQREVTFVWLPELERLDLTVKGRTYRMIPEESASGARFRSQQHAETWFWNKGETATLRIEGNTYPQCLAKGALEMPFEARGNEPFWRIEILPGQLWLETPDQKPLSMAWELRKKRETGRVYRAEAEGVQLFVTAVRQLCRDTMTGMPYPNYVRITLNGEEHQGCGGSPEQLFRGITWYPEELAGSRVLEDARPSLRFLDRNRITGSTGCKEFSGRYALTGEGMSVSGLTVSGNDCGEAASTQETRLLELLEGTTRFDMGQQGELRLINAEGEEVVSVRVLPKRPPWLR